MKIENVVKKFNLNLLYNCPKCKKEACIKGKSIICLNNHVYDFSKKGYIHLIPNYKDTKYSEELFLARESVFKSGFYNHIVLAIEEELKKINAKNIIDIGCGEGYYIKTLKDKFPEKYFFGLDNSKYAIELAVKDDKVNPYLLANLANLPFSDNSFDLVLNILTPANYDEFARILKEDGVIIKLLATKNYLKEIREIFDNSDYSNDNMVDVLEKYCTVLERRIITKDFLLTSTQAEEFLRMTPLTFSKIIKKEHIKKLKKITVELEMIIAKVKN